MFGIVNVNCDYDFFHFPTKLVVNLCEDSQIIFEGQHTNLISKRLSQDC